MKKDIIKKYIDKRDYLKIKEIFLIIASLLIFPIPLVFSFLGVRMLFSFKKMNKLVEKAYYNSRTFSYILLTISTINLGVTIGRIKYIYEVTKNKGSLDILPSIYDYIFFYGHNKMFSAGVQLIGAVILLNMSMSILFKCYGLRNAKWVYISKSKSLVRALFGERLPYLRILKDEVFENRDVKNDYFGFFIPIIYKIVSIIMLLSLLRIVGEYYVLFVKVDTRNFVEFIFTAFYYGIFRTILVISAVIFWIKLRTENYC